MTRRHDAHRHREREQRRTYALNSALIGSKDGRRFDHRAREAHTQKRERHLRDPSDTIFHVFYDIDSLDIIPQDYDLGRPVIRGIFEDNDRTKRLMAVINFNTDVSNFWEFSANGMKPVSDATEAYKLGVNYVIYGIMH